MSVTIRLYEAKALKNVDGSIKVSVKLKEGTRESLPVYSPSVPESSNPDWTQSTGDAASLTLDTYGYDLSYAEVLISVISGGENVGTVELPLTRILGSPGEFEDRKL